METASNPVLAPTRLSLEEMLEARTILARQDLAGLKSQLEGAERNLAPALPELEGRDEALNSARALVKELQASVKEAQEAPAEDLSFLTDAGTVPVCGIVHGDHPVHPAGVNNKQGKACVARTFGPGGGGADSLGMAMQYVAKERVLEVGRKLVYSQGSRAGFYKRLRLQTTRKCVQEAPKKGLLKTLFPYDPTKLVDVSQELSGLVLGIKTNATASAGPPFWRTKREALTDMLDCVLPLMYQHIVEGRLPELRNKHPELFICECKNKLDRYDPVNLQNKTRPYFSGGFHLTALISVLSQSFSGALKIMTEDDRSMNAYGFSWAHGGATKLVRWARQVTELGRGSKGEGRPRIACYGDDTDIYYRRGGTLYRVCPDFTQMDGSVDYSTIKATIEFVVKAHTTQWPMTGDFWEAVGELWLEMATSMPFLLDGTTLYKKKSKDGLLSGVVGTTLFDTVKSGIAYDDWATQVHDYKKFELLEEKPALKFFLEKHGLVIKPGTWVPEKVNEYPGAGELWTSQKFLGLQLMCRRASGEELFVPTLPFDDWLSMFVTPREKMGSKESLTMRQRANFDRARGLLVTGAAFDEQARRFFGSVINSTPVEVVCMKVQEGGGRGAPPEYAVLTRDGNFKFPVSDGYPSEDWVEALYGFGETPSMPPVVPDALALISKYKRRALTTRVVIKYMDTPVLASVKEPTQEVNMPMDPEAHVAATQKPSIKPREHTFAEKVDTKGGVLTVDKLARVPSSTEALESIMLTFMEEMRKRLGDLEAKMGAPVSVVGAALPLKALEEKLGPTQVAERAEDAGFSVFQTEGGAYASTHLVQDHPEQMESLARAAERQKVVGKNTTTLRAQRVKVAQESEPAYSENAGVEEKGPWPQPLPKAFSSDFEPWESVTQAMGKTGNQLTTGTEDVRSSDGTALTRVLLMYRNQATGSKAWTPWLEAVSTSKKSAKNLLARYILDRAFANRRDDLDLSQAGAWAEDVEAYEQLQVLDKGKHVFSLLGEVFRRVNPHLTTRHLVGPSGDLMIFREDGTVQTVAPPRRDKNGRPKKTLASVSASLTKVNRHLVGVRSGQPAPRGDFRAPQKEVKTSPVKPPFPETQQTIEHKNDETQPEPVGIGCQPQQYTRQPTPEPSPIPGGSRELDSPDGDYDSVRDVPEPPTQLSGGAQRRPFRGCEGSPGPRPETSVPKMHAPKFRDPDARVQKLEDQLQSLQRQLKTVLGSESKNRQGSGQKQGGGHGGDRGSGRKGGGYRGQPGDQQRRGNQTRYWSPRRSEGFSDRH